jgi:hypothetical protein
MSLTRIYCMIPLKAHFRLGSRISIAASLTFIAPVDFDPSPPLAGVWR